MTEEEFIRNLPAFPYEHRFGMTLRDYFAAKAMQGLIASDIDSVVPPISIAQDAYDIADAMLKARQA